MVGYIYLTTNTVNGMMYIGKHKADSFKGKAYIGSGARLKEAIKLYGRKNFICDLLESCDTIEELNNRERYWIAVFNATENPTFYNIADGGVGSSGKVFGSVMKEAWCTPEYRSSHVKGNLLYWQNPENYEKRLNINRNADHKSVWTEELREKQRNVQKVAWNNPDLRSKHSKNMQDIWSDPARIEAQRARNVGEGNPSFGKHYYVDGNDNWVFCKPEDAPKGYYKAKYSWIYKDGIKKRHEAAKPIPDGWSDVP